LQVDFTQQQLLCKQEVSDDVLQKSIFTDTAALLLLRYSYKHAKKTLGKTLHGRDAQDGERHALPALPLHLFVHRRFDVGNSWSDEVGEFGCVRCFLFAEIFLVIYPK